jgi:hypothetical protein
MFQELTSRIQKANFPPRLLISKFRFLDEQSKYSTSCLDPYYLPFYYHLGTVSPGNSLLEFGFGLGLNAACYLLGSPDTSNYLSIQEPTDEYYSTRLGIGNIKQAWKKPFHVHFGMYYDEDFVSKINERKWNICLISDRRSYDTHMSWLNMAWDALEEGGLIFMDYINSSDLVKRAYTDFCIIKQREQQVFPTRYNVGMIMR